MTKIYFFALALITSSCTVTNYYQVFKTKSENGTFNNDKIAFEDNNCSVSYNLWKEGGNIGFSIYNKTENDLIIHLNKTFFVLNGFAFEYFQNRTFTNSSNLGASVALYSSTSSLKNSIAKVEGTSSTSVSTGYMEKPCVTIPANTSINISEFKIADKYHSDCDLPWNPIKKNIKTINYSKDNTPYSFYNLITYSTPKDTLRIQNTFYVSEITNYPDYQMFKFVDTTFCGTFLEYPVKKFKDVTPDKFYIKY